MREIRFRAWDVNDECMVYPKHFVMSDYGRIVAGYQDFFTGDMFIEYEKLMQYVGLKDRQGKEIYEGDIVKVFWVDAVNDEAMHKVVWNPYDNSYPAFDLVPQIDCDCNAFSYLFEDSEYEIEVIGNIYQNPELIVEVAG